MAPRARARRHGEDTMASLTGRILTRLILRPRVRKLSWDQLVKGAVVSAERFDESIARVKEEASTVSAGGYMSIRDTLAHLTAGNEMIAARLDAFRAGDPRPAGEVNMYAAAQGGSLAQLREAHRR